MHVIICMDCRRAATACVEREDGFWPNEYQKSTIGGRRHAMEYVSGVVGCGAVLFVMHYTLLKSPLCSKKIRRRCGASGLAVQPAGAIDHCTLISREGNPRITRQTGYLRKKNLRRRNMSKHYWFRRKPTDGGS